MASSLRISAAQPSRAAPSRSVPSARSFYHPELDSLRWWGFRAIFTAHISPWTPALYQTLGLSRAEIEVVLGAKRAMGFTLDMFFVLSAYLITTLLLREIRLNGHLDVRAFYFRRILRIWPLYFAFVIAICIAGFFYHPLRASWYATAAYFVLLGNFVPVVGLFNPLPLGPLWSISVEEQFYLSLPLVLRRISERTLIAPAVALIVCSEIARLVLASRHVEYAALWCSTFTRLDPFAGGIIMAVVLRGDVPQLSGVRRAAIFLFSVMAWFVAGYWFPFMPGRISMLSASVAYPLGALGACGVVLSSLRGDSKGLVILTAPVFTYLGKITYGLYVMHVFFIDASFRLFQILVGNPRPPQDRLSSYLVCFAIALAMTIACAMASYRWLESPFLRKKQRITHVQSRPV